MSDLTPSTTTDPAIPEEVREATLATFDQLRRQAMIQLRDRLVEKAKTVDLSNPRIAKLFQNAVFDVESVHEQAEAQLRAKLTPPIAEAELPIVLDGALSVRLAPASSSLNEPVSPVVEVEGEAS